ncbi:MAG: hypothetical protein RL437_133 [Actinomycetota bacterium]|jgi:transketolase
MVNLPFTDAKTLATEARKQIVRITSIAKASHVASALSVVDVLAFLYSGGANINKNNRQAADRDIVILSKGHSAAALYSVLALQEFFPVDWLDSYCQDNAALGGHVTFKGVPGVELSTGSLGHGLPYGLGIALSRSRDKKSGRVFVVMSDGECDEGTTWESAMIAHHYDLKNLTVIIDRNRIQSLANTEETLKLEPFADKWRAFGWNVYDVDGHNFEELRIAINNQTKPTCVIANTTKGKGVSFMENSVLWHYKSPSESDVIDALNQIEAAK